MDQPRRCRGCEDRYVVTVEKGLCPDCARVQIILRSKFDDPAKRRRALRMLAEALLPDEVA